MSDLENQKKDRILLMVSAILLTAFEMFSIYKLMSQSGGLIPLILFPVLFLLNALFIKKFIEAYKIEKKKAKAYLELAILFVFGTFLIKSFIIYIYPFARMKPIIAVLYGFGWSLFGMSLTYLIKHYALKISWINDTRSKKSIVMYLKFCIPSIIILGIVFAIYYPGIGSIDTQYIWQRVHENSFTDTHPLMFLMLYKGLSIVWDNIAVVTLFQYIICVLAYGYVAYYFFTKGLKKAWSWVIAIALPIIPINALYSVTLWKDIPYSVGLLVFIIMTIKVFEDNYLDRAINIIELVLVGLFVMFMRHNGFIPILGTVGFVWLYHLITKEYKQMFKLMAIGIALLVLFFGTKSGVGILLSGISSSQSEQIESKESVSYDNKTIVPSVFPTTVAAQQIVYIEHYHGDTFTQEQKENFETYFKIDKLEAHKFEYRMGNKYGPNWEFYHKPYLYQKGIAIADLDKFWSFYRELFIQHPITALESYQKITGITWASIGYGPTAYRTYAGDRFSEYVNDGYSDFMAPIRETLNNTIFNILPGVFIIFIRPAFYLMVICLFCFVGFKRHKAKYIIAMSPVFLNLLGYLLVIAAQDVRYFFINMSAFIVAIAYATMKKENAKETALDEK